MDLGSYTSETVSNKALKEKVMASQSDGGKNYLTFTFVPATGTLPSKVSFGKVVNYLPKILTEQKGTIVQKPGESNERMSKKNIHESSEEFLDTCHKLGFRDNFPEENSGFNNPKEIKHNDLFIAEFVVVTDSDDGEDKINTKKNQGMPFKEKGYEFKRMRQSTVQPKAAKAQANVNEIYIPDVHQEFSHDQLCSVSSVGVDPYGHQFTNLSNPSKRITEHKRQFIPSVPANINTNQTEAMHNFQNPQLSKSNSCNISMTKKPNIQLINSPTFPNCSQMQSQYTPLRSKRSNALSQLPIQIIKYPLCRSPSPLNSSVYGSSSTICSMNDCTSPVPRHETVSPVQSRLSFLTSLLKSKKSIYNRTCSPDVSQYDPSIKPGSQHSFFYKTATTSSPPRKSQSCFSLNYPKDSKPINFQRKNEILPSTSESDIFYSKSSFHSEPLRSLSPESTRLRSFSSSFLSRKGVVSPLPELSHQPNSIFHSSRENIPHLNEKPPLNRPTYTPLKKYSVLGRSKRITLFPPPLPFHHSPSNIASQKSNVIQYKKRYLPVKGSFRSNESTENLGQSHARSTSPMDITESHRISPFASNVWNPSYENVDSERNISLLHPSCTREFLSFEELSRNYSPIYSSPTNFLRSPRSNLSSSCELRSPSSLSQRSDQENKQSYKIKSSYKAFAAIPTNTLLRDQKAIDKPDINTDNTGSSEKIDSRSEMCSPALLRQQTEEICAAIDEVLHNDPLPVHCKSVSKPTIKKTDPRLANLLKSPRKSPGRETRYASIQHLANTGMKNLEKTRPGVIRPVSLKISTTEPMDGCFSASDHQHFSMPPYRRKTDFIESSSEKDVSLRL